MVPLGVVTTNVVLPKKLYHNASYVLTKFQAQYMNKKSLSEK